MAFTPDIGTRGLELVAAWLTVLMLHTSLADTSLVGIY